MWLSHENQGESKMVKILQLQKNGRSATLLSFLIRQHQEKSIKLFSAGQRTKMLGWSYFSKTCSIVPFKILSLYIIPTIQLLPWARLPYSNYTVGAPTLFTLYRGSAYPIHIIPWARLPYSHYTVGTPTLFTLYRGHAYPIHIIPWARTISSYPPGRFVNRVDAKPPVFRDGVL